MDRATQIRFGLHNSGYAFAAPGTIERIDAESHDFRPKGRARIDRAQSSILNAHYPSILGVNNVEARSLEMLFRGVSGNDGGAFTPQTAMEQARMLDSFFGTAASAIAGAAPTLSSGTSPAITVSSTVLVNGEIILFQTSAGRQIRQVVSGGGTSTVTLSHGYAGAVVASSTVIRLARWVSSQIAQDHLHGYFEAANEVDDWEAIYSGCFCESLSLDLTEGDIVRMSTSWIPSVVSVGDYDREGAAAPTAGGYVPTVGGQLMIGADSFLLRSGSIEAQSVPARRMSLTSENGHVGARAVDFTASFSAQIEVESGTITGGMDADAWLDALGAGAGDEPGIISGTNDVMIQLGGSATACAFIRFPAAELRGNIVAGPEGQAMVEIEGVARSPATGSKMTLGVG